MVNYQPQSDFLANKTILVTGAGDGIGKEASLHYAKYGASVILLGRTVKKLELVYDEIVANGGAEPAIVPLDLLGATHNIIGIWHQPLKINLDNLMDSCITQVC